MYTKLAQSSHQYFEKVAPKVASRQSQILGRQRLPKVAKFALFRNEFSLSAFAYVWQLWRWRTDRQTYTQTDTRRQHIGLSLNATEAVFPLRFQHLWHPRDFLERMSLKSHEEIGRVEQGCYEEMGLVELKL